MMLLNSFLVLACSVCAGNPADSMVKGAMAGVFVLGGVILGVQVWIGATILFWSRRAKRLALNESTNPKTPGTQTS